MPSQTNPPSAFEQWVSKMVAGFTNNVPSSVTSVTIQGTTLTVAQILAQLTGIASRLSAVDSARELLKEAIATRAANMVADRTFVNDLASALKLMIGPSNQAQLASFGVAPTKARAPLSGEERTIASAKSKATRALRGTMGK